MCVSRVSFCGVCSTRTRAQCGVVKESKCVFLFLCAVRVCQVHIRCIARTLVGSRVFTRRQQRRQSIAESMIDEALHSEFLHANVFCCVLCCVCNVMCVKTACVLDSGAGSTDDDDGRDARFAGIRWLIERCLGRVFWRSVHTSRTAQHIDTFTTHAHEYAYSVYVCVCSTFRASVYACVPRSCCVYRCVCLWV